MPQIIRSIDEIMAATKRDVFFLRMKRAEQDFVSPRREEAESRPAFLRHVAWFAANGLTWEEAQPRGLIEGYGGLYVVWFDGPDEPRVAAYGAEFENDDGLSREPENYQLYLLRYDDWLQHRPPPDDEF